MPIGFLRTFHGFLVKKHSHHLHFGVSSAMGVRHKIVGDAAINGWITLGDDGIVDGLGDSALNLIHIDPDSSMDFDSTFYVELDLPDRGIIEEMEVRYENDHLVGTDNLRFVLERVGVDEETVKVTTGVTDGSATVINSLISVDVGDTSNRDSVVQAFNGTAGEDRVRRDLFSYRLRVTYLGESIGATGAPKTVHWHWVRVKMGS